MKWNFNIIGFILIYSCFIVINTENSACQNFEQLGKKKQDNLLELKFSKSLLEKTSTTKNLTLNQLDLIQKNIKLRSEIIENISVELGYLHKDIEANNKEIITIGDEILKIKEEYANCILAASRNLDKDFALMYIFSSQDFNQAYQRVKYLKYLARYRSDLTVKLQIEIENLKFKNNELALRKGTNEQLLLERKKELGLLDKDKNNNVLLIRNLRKREDELKSDIKKRERIQDELEKEIRKIIEEEAVKAKESKKGILISDEDRILSSDFVKNYGKLPWPSDQKILTGKYGEQNHPILKGIKIRCNGIDINTSEGSKVRCVFNGEVTKVIAILGANYTVIIRHGEYRSVYQNLIDVKVKAGDKVKTKEIIGTVFTDQDKVSKYHFEIWKNKITQNPEDWLSN